jgi:hypothetical protein
VTEQLWFVTHVYGDDKTLQGGMVRVTAIYYDLREDLLKLGPVNVNYIALSKFML